MMHKVVVIGAPEKIVLLGFDRDVTPGWQDVEKRYAALDCVSGIPQEMKTYINESHEYLRKQLPGDK